jgi:ribosomal-protein-alanine N-acetyltransferase
MRQADIPDILTIESVSFGPHHWSADSFRHELNNTLARYAVLMQQRPDAAAASRAPLGATETLQGYSGYWLVEEEVHITTLAVAPAMQGCHLGELLIAHMLDLATGHSARWATLEVRASNQKAQRLYQKYGFHVAGLRPRYYMDNQEDALIMTSADLGTAASRQMLKERRQQLAQCFGGQLPEGFGKN